MSAASSAEKSNTAQISGTTPQKPSTSTDVGSTSEWRPGKNYERNQRRKQQKRLLKGIKGITLTNPGGDLPTAYNSAFMKRSRESSQVLNRPQHQTLNKSVVGSNPNMLSKRNKPSRGSGD